MSYTQITDRHFQDVAEQGDESDKGQIQGFRLNKSLESAIRKKANQLWLAAGCPVGDEVKFWLQAERMLTL